MSDTETRYDRRTMLKGIGGCLLGTGLAGCSGPGGEGEGEEEGEEEGESEEEEE